MVSLLLLVMISLMQIWPSGTKSLSRKGFLYIPRGQMTFVLVKLTTHSKCLAQLPKLPN